MKKLYILLLFILPLFSYSQITTSAMNMTVECDGGGNIAALNAWLSSHGGAVASTACGTVTWSDNFTSLTENCGSTGSTTVTFTATNTCEMATTTATFTIQDTTYPTITALSNDMTVACDGSGNTSQLNAWLNSNGGAEAFDNCGDVDWFYNFPGLTSDCSETVSAEALFTVTDACGNEEYTYSTFTIESAAGDCPATPIILSSQADVDAFVVNYPNCTQLNNSLTIGGADIVDLTPLSSINSVKSLIIEGNTLLSDLNGLDSINHIDGEDAFNGLIISNNEVLEDISSLINMTNDVPIENLAVVNNPLLVSLNGLQGIEEVLFNISIENNDSLTNLFGILNLQPYETTSVINNDLLQSLDGIGTDLTYGGIEVVNNAQLSDISALDGLTSFIGFSIVNNPNLSVCNINSICLKLMSEEQFQYTIENNGPSCESILQVAYNCGLVPSNDDCNGATDLTLNETIQAYNEFGTQSPQTPSCNDTNRVDVWFTFNSATLDSVDITINADFNMQLWEGTCTSLTQVTNACGSNMLDDVAVTANTDYYLQVWSDGTGGRRATGLFEVLVQNATLSIADNNFEGFSIYPNPVNELLNFKSVKTIDELQVFNLLGQNVMTTTPKTSQSQIDMSGFTSGLYILKVRIGNEMTSYKIMKE